MSAGFDQAVAKGLQDLCEKYAAKILDLKEGTSLLIRELRETTKQRDDARSCYDQAHKKIQETDVQIEKWKARALKAESEVAGLGARVNAAEEEVEDLVDELDEAKGATATWSRQIAIAIPSGIALRVNGSVYRGLFFLQVNSDGSAYINGAQI